MIVGAQNEIKGDRYRVPIPVWRSTETVRLTCAARRRSAKRTPVGNSVSAALFSFVLLAWGNLVSAEDDRFAQPELYRRIEIPSRLLQRSEDGGHLFGGDVRMGDLTGDGQVDFVVFRSAAPGIKTCFLGAFTGEGRYLWHVGVGGDQPTRPGSVAIHDIDGDGRSEVICLFQDRSRRAPSHSFADMTIQIRDGATGRLERAAAPKELTRWTSRLQQAGTHGNWAHQRIIIANFRGRHVPQDFAIKLGFDYLAFDNDLRLLWNHRVPRHGRNEHCSYIPDVGDVDGDGRDELFGGQVLIDDDGRRRWYQIKARPTDSVYVLPWDEGRVRLITSGHGLVMNAQGEPLFELGPQVVPHGQEVRVANFTDQSPGLEMMLRYNGHNPDVMLISNQGTVLHRFELNRRPNNTGMEVVRWHGRQRPALLYYGGKLWAADGTCLGDLPDLPPLKGPVGDNRTMAFYHAIPADVCGDRREEVVLFNPWDRYVLIYSPARIDRDAFAGYRPTARQYNVRLMD